MFGIFAGVMRRKTKIWLTVLLIVLVCVACVAYTQRDNISAFIDSFRYSQEEVINKLEENKESIQKFVDETPEVTVRDLTEQEAQALNDGELTEEDAVKILTGQSEKSNSDASENGSDQNTGVVSGKDTANGTDKDSNQIVSEAIAKLYVQKSAYLSKLDAIEATVRQQYIDLPKEERKGAKQRFLSAYLPQVAAWESQCDSVVYGILDEITVALKNAGQDTDIVKKLEEAYLNEKKLKKTYFINRYMD